MDPFLYQIDAQNWSFVVLNSLAKVNKNKVISFERLKISLKSFMGIHNTSHQVQWRDCQGGHCNALWFFFLWGPFVRLKHAELSALSALLAAESLVAFTAVAALQASSVVSKYAALFIALCHSESAPE